MVPGEVIVLPVPYVAVPVSVLVDVGLTSVETVLVTVVVDLHVVEYEYDFQWKVVGQARLSRPRSRWSSIAKGPWYGAASAAAARLRTERSVN